MDIFIAFATSLILIASSIISWTLAMLSLVDDGGVQHIFDFRKRIVFQKQILYDRLILYFFYFHLKNTHIDSLRSLK